MTQEEYWNLKPGDILRCGWNRYWRVLANHYPTSKEWTLAVEECKKIFHGEHHQRGSWVSGHEQLKRIA